MGRIYCQDSRGDQMKRSILGHKLDVIGALLKLKCMDCLIPMTQWKNYTWVYECPECEIAVRLIDDGE